jgi:uncharacterized membrane protein YfcA
MTQAIGFALAGAAGFSLGLIGGGGALLTVPILVYGFQIPALLGTGYSLFVVGVTSLIGAVLSFRQRRVCLKTAIAFALPSMMSVFAARAAVHRIPASFALPYFGPVTRDGFLMGLFGLTMVAAAIAILKPIRQAPPGSESCVYRPVLGALGLAVGALTGLFGAGGGFLIVPALTRWAKLPIEKAMGTSLVIVAANSWFGFCNDLARNRGWDWPFVLGFSSVSLAGVLLGQMASGRMRASGLKHAFAWLTFSLGLFIFLKEISQGIAS